MSTGALVVSPHNRTVRADFMRKTLPKPGVSLELVNKVRGAYQHVTEVYNYPKMDIHFGPAAFKLEGASTGYAEYKEEFNSVVLATILNSLLCGSMLFMGEPGTGKTTTPEVVGQILFGLTLDEIQQATHYCNPQLTEEKLIGGYHLPKLLNGEKEVVWGHWVESFYRMLDEANRMAPETSAIFLQALDRRQASYAGEVKDMPFGPVFATANPFDSGNFEMTPPFLDRFGVSVFTTGINAGFLDSIFSPSDQIDRASHALSLEERMRIYGEIQSIGIRNETLRFLSYLAGGLTSCQGPKGLGYQDHDKSLLPNNKHAFEFCGEACNFEYGRVVCSQIKERSLGRGILALRDYGRALAWLMGKTEIDNEIMFWTFQMVMGHRLNPSKAAMDGGESPLGPDIDKKNLFPSKTWYFVKHLWELGRNSYTAQESALNQYYGFFENMEGSSVSQIKTDSENVLKTVDAMTDPAKWGMLTAIRSVRKAIEGLGG